MYYSIYIYIYYGGSLKKGGHTGTRYDFTLMQVTLLDELCSETPELVVCGLC